MSVRLILRQIPDLRGKQGRQHPLEAILGLILLSMLSGRKGLMAAFRLGRSLSSRQLKRLGFRPGCGSPCHATLTETLRVLDADAMATVFSQFMTAPVGSGNDEEAGRHIAMDGKTLRASKNGDGNAQHVLSAFCAELGQSVGHVSSRGTGREIPDALRLIDRLDLEGRIITGDAVFCQKTITSRIVDKGADYVLTVKKNQENLHEEIETAFKEPVFPPGTLPGAAGTRSRTD
ncbi:ISAs1 family transposase [Hoeflea sp.]|uniref:ISAs1 family transposase n=1 Tax=Hoeflea sp. TaxID=1940281 RepID=UPI003B01A061